MGAAIAGAIARAGLAVWLSNRSRGKLDTVKAQYPQINITTDNCEAVAHADIVVLAVKPVYVYDVINEFRDYVIEHKLPVVSVVGGMTLNNLSNMIVPFDKYENPLFQVIPDTAIVVGKGMTFVTARNASSELVDEICSVFKCVGEVAVIEERLMNAATALSSCGIAYAYKYVQACVQAGVELGLTAADALRYTVATVEGAMAMLKREGAKPQDEIDRVCSPGGMTIRGINALEDGRFTATVINAIKKPVSSEE